MLQGGAGGPTSDLLGGKRRRFGDRGGEAEAEAEEESGTALTFFTLGWPSIKDKACQSILYSAVVGHLGHIYMNKGCSTIAGKKDPDASAGFFSSGTVPDDLFIKRNNICFK